TIRPAIARKPAAAHKTSSRPQRSAVSNHSLAGAASDVAGVVQEARAAPRAGGPHAVAVARDFGLPLSALEIHAGGAAGAACRLINAKAFTVQSVVVFAEPRPSLSLVRHEFAHVLQQQGVLHPAPARYWPGSLSIGAAGSEIEHEADAAVAGNV